MLNPKDRGTKEDQNGNSHRIEFRQVIKGFQSSRWVLLIALLTLITACAGRQNRQVTTIPSLGAPAGLVVPENTAAPLAAATPSPTYEPVVIDTFQDWRMTLYQIRQASPAEAQVRTDQLWESLNAENRVPLVIGRQVVFLYKGEAAQVNWSGSFNKWNAPGLEGTRVGKTDLWMAYLELPEACRIEYKIVLNGQDWIVDPANQNTTFSGLTGANNVLVTPGFSVTDESKKRADIAHGSLTDTLSINSPALGYTVNYQVYQPGGYESLDELPVVYVLDGNDFSDDRMGALPNVLDNLIADGRIQPVLAVFIDAREPGNPQKNRREEEFLVRPVEHARFIADELVPVIDRTYRTIPDPEARVIMGVSYGGLSAYYIAAARSDIFHNLAALSPSLWVLASPQYVTDPKQQKGSQKMLPAVNEQATACGGNTGYACPRLPLKIFLSAGWPDWDVGDFRVLIADMQRQKYPIEFHSVREGHTWDNWRSLSDEMLTYFFGIN